MFAHALSPHHFQLHGPQTGPLIPSHFPIKVCQFVPSCTFRLGHITSAAAKEKKWTHAHMQPFPFEKEARTHWPQTDTHTLTCLHNIWSRRACLLTVREKRDSVAFHKPSRNRSKQKDCGVSREVPNWKQHRPQDRRLSYSVVLIR